LNVQIKMELRNGWFTFAPEDAEELTASLESHLNIPSRVAIKVPQNLDLAVGGSIVNGCS